ncbi:MAG: response regulator transcription factor [Candidatus Omnitrophica bacterium]|nr:response regulator transcription factor [Candidatus Omnitrophota bacterium]
MESLLLIESNGSSLKQVKSQFVRSGFRVVVCDAAGLERLDAGKERFLLIVADGTDSSRLAGTVAQVRSKPFLKEIGLVLLIKESQMKELGQLTGVEDFLILPCDPSMVESRVRFVLKRMNRSAPGEEGIQVGKLKLDIDRYEVTLDGEPLELTYKEFELLKFLATHPGKVFSRDQLLNQVWGYDFIGGTRTVDVHIRRLRAKLGPKYASLIDTVRNVGYKFLENL